jgi:hypothetical protein
MSTDLKDWRIAEGTVRITLFRILPGHEIEVGRNIEKLIGGKDHHSRVYRLFGSYDLVYITDSSSLISNEFSRVGTIPYIMGCDEYICYKWIQNNENQPSFRMNLLENPLLSLYFLKINPQLVQKMGLRPEIAFAEKLKQKLPQVQMLGTFGWFEIILLLSGSTISSVLDVVGNQIPNLSFYFQMKESKKPFFVTEKSLTLLGHNLDVSDQKSRIKQIVNLYDPMLKSENLNINLSLSCKPNTLKELTEDAAKHFNLERVNGLWKGVDYLFGPRDLAISLPIKNITTLNEIIYSLDNFRSKHKNIILKTYTDIHYQRKLAESPDGQPDVNRHPILYLTQKDANKLVDIGPEGAAIAGAINGYNNLLQNNLGSDAFIDLLKYVQYLRDLPKKEFSNKLAIGDLHALVQRLNLLKEAIDQRSQGVYTGFDETPFTPGFTGVAMIKIYKALEAYISILLLRFQKNWSGFVIFGSSSRFEHKQEAIIIPPECSLSAPDHWCLTHETMHILQYLYPEILSLNNIFPDNIDPYISRYRIGQREFGALMTEMIADVLDYTFCCPNNIDPDDYFLIIWKYLGNVVFEHEEETQISNYLYRSFTVIYYEYIKAHGVKNPNWNDYLETRKIILEKEYLYRKIKILRPLFTKIDESGENNFTIKVDEYHRHFVPGLKYLFSAIEKISKLYTPNNFDKHQVNDIIQALNEGRILETKKINIPEIITWTLARNLVNREKGQFSERGNVAFLLSLWHAYHVNTLGFDISKFLT